MLDDRVEVLWSELGHHMGLDLLPHDSTGPQLVLFDVELLEVPCDELALPCVRYQSRKHAGHIDQPNIMPRAADSYFAIRLSMATIPNAMLSGGASRVRARALCLSNFRCYVQPRAMGNY